MTHSNPEAGENKKGGVSPYQNQTRENSSSAPAHSRAERIAACVGIAQILALYAIAIIASLIDSPAARSVLMSAIFLTIAVPVLIYLFRFCLRLFKPRLPIQQDRNGAEPSGQPNAAPEQPASAVDAAAKTAGTPGTSSKKRR